MKRNLEMLSRRRFLSKVAQASGGVAALTLAPSLHAAIPGVKVTEHLSQCAKVLDRFVLIRTVNHNVIDEHAAATNRLHTGRPTSGTVIYPSIGSIVAHERKGAVEGVPAYV